MVRIIAAILSLLLIASCTSEEAPTPSHAKIVQVTPAMAYGVLTEKPPARRIAADFQRAIAQGDTRFLSINGRTPIASTRPGLVEHFGTRPGVSIVDVISKQITTKGVQKDDNAYDEDLGDEMNAPMYNLAMLYYLESNHQIPLTQPTTR
jgi:hypothetical protein